MTCQVLSITSFVSGLEPKGPGRDARRTRVAQQQGGGGPWWTVVLMVCAVLLASVVLSGCGAEEAEDPGVLSLGWRVSPLGCGESGVEMVELSMIGLDGQPAVAKSTPCNTKRAVIDGLEPGQYAFDLVGFDKTGKAIFESGTKNIAIRPSEVTSMNDVRLTARAGSLGVTWFFKNGRLCSSNSVETIVVGVYDMDAYAIDEQVFSCNAGVGTVQGLQSGQFFIEVIGLAPDQTGLFRGFEEIELGRGDELILEVPLSECGEEC